ncbi:MAG: hypothetical protein IJ864_02285 [Alphaproteobacteria bacterium]|nr:hypothetical protein [Alphaproteobacteria bacterium]
MENKLEQALNIAQTYDVTTPKDGAVVYSISFMPTDENKKDAERFVKEHPFTKRLDDTPCGKALIALGLDGKVNEVGETITKIWHVASERYIKAASGNIHAFVEGADERSTFCTTELAEIMKNSKITHINGVEKRQFIAVFEPKKY